MERSERFASLPADRPIKSFNLSQYAMLQYLCMGLFKTGLLLEDDVVFQPFDHLQDAIDELPADWDMLYLGANLTNGQPVKYSKHLYRVGKAWTTHAVAYSKQGANKIRAAYDPGSGTMYDAWLSEEMLPKLNAFVVNPMVAFQRPGKSDLWGTETDYTPCFEQGNKIMSI